MFAVRGSSFSCYICLLSMGNNFEDQIYVLGEFELFDLRAVVAMKNPRWRRRVTKMIITGTAC